MMRQYTSGLFLTNRYTDLGTIDGGLVHALDNRRPSAKNDQEVQHERLAPTVSILVSQPALFLLGEQINSLITGRSILYASHQGTFVEGLALVRKSTGFDELIDIFEDLILSHASERIAQLGSDAGASASLVFIVSNILTGVAGCG